MSSMVMRFLASMTKMRFSRSLHSGDSCSVCGGGPRVGRGCVRWLVVGEVWCGGGVAGAAQRVMPPGRASPGRCPAAERASCSLAARAGSLCPSSSTPPPHPALAFLMASAMCGTSLHRLDTCCSQTSRCASLVLGSGCSAGGGRSEGEYRPAGRAQEPGCGRQAGRCGQKQEQARLVEARSPPSTQLVLPGTGSLGGGAGRRAPTCVVEGEGAQQHDEQQDAAGPHVHAAPVVPNLQRCAGCGAGWAREQRPGQAGRPVD